MKLFKNTIKNWLCVLIIYAFKSESTLCSFLNVNKLLTRNRRDIWSLSDRNGIRIHEHLLRKGTLRHYAKLASLAKCLSVRLATKWFWVRIKKYISLFINSIHYPWMFLQHCNFIFLLQKQPYADVPQVRCS